MENMLALVREGRIGSGSKETQEAGSIDGRVKIRTIRRKI